MGPIFLSDPSFGAFYFQFFVEEFSLRSFPEMISCLSGPFRMHIDQSPEMTYDNMLLLLLLLCSAPREMWNVKEREWRESFLIHKRKTYSLIAKSVAR